MTGVDRARHWRRNGFGTGIYVRRKLSVIRRISFMNQRYRRSVRWGFFGNRSSSRDRKFHSTNSPAFAYFRDIFWRKWWTIGADQFGLGGFFGSDSTYWYRNKCLIICRHQFLMIGRDRKNGKDIFLYLGHERHRLFRHHGLHGYQDDFSHFVSKWPTFGFVLCRYRNGHSLQRQAYFTRKASALWDIHSYLNHLGQTAQRLVGLSC